MIVAIAVLNAPPLLIRNEEFPCYEQDPEFQDNLEPHGNNFKFIEDNPCRYYDSSAKRCIVYNKRPISCQTYPLSDLGLHISPKCNNAIQIAAVKIRNLIDDCLSFNL